MFPFVCFNASNVRRACSHFAVAIALTGAAAGISPIFETPAYAQKSEYSKGFVGAYQPVNEAFVAEEPDLATVKAGIPAIVAAIETQDDRFAAGNLIYNYGAKVKDLETQRQGLGLMLESGKVGEEQVSLFNFIGGQLSFNLNDYAAARDYLQAAIDAGYSSDDAGALIAETYFAEERDQEGIDYLTQHIANKRAAGETVDKAWLERGFAKAYNAGLGTAAADFGAQLVAVDPTPTTWGNAIGVLRIYGEYDDQAILDLMRLADREGSLKTERDYVDYIEAADARRLPAEVDQIVDEGIEAGLLKADDVFVAEAKSIASDRLETDKSDLPDLASDARAASSTANTAMAAGDAFLSWDDPATAEEMYKIALTKADVDTPRVTTRLGIAQADQGKWAEAQETFSKIEGKRAPIARLWTIHAENHASGGAEVAGATSPEA